MKSLKVFLDEYAKVPLYNYQIDILTKAVEGKTLTISTPRRKTNNIKSIFDELDRIYLWRERARKFNAPEKVEFP